MHEYKQAFDTTDLKKGVGGDVLPASRKFEDSLDEKNTSLYFFRGFRS